MKVLTILSYGCSLCREYFGGIAAQKMTPYRTIIVTTPRQSTGPKWWSIYFHKHCWDQATNNSLNFEFTHDEWIDFAGDEWGVLNLTKYITSKGGSSYLAQGKFVSREEFKSLKSQQPK